MPKRIPAMSSRKFVRLLEKGGARFVRQKGTSHAIYERIVNHVKLRAPVVMDKRELSPKYTKTVFRQLSFTNEEIDDVLR